MMPRERLLQHRLQQRWHLRRKGLGADRRRDIALLGQLHSRSVRQARIDTSLPNSFMPWRGRVSRVS